MNLHDSQCWQITFFLLFLKQRVCQRHLLGVWLCVLSSFSLSFCSSVVHFKKGPEYLTKEYYKRYLFLLLDFCCRIWFFKKCSRSSEVLFSYSFHSFLFACSVCFKYSQVLVIFLFSKCSADWVVLFL